MWPSTPYRAKTGFFPRVLLALAALALIALGLESFRAARDLNQTRADVADVRRTYIATVDVLNAVSECVSATRGYAITGDEIFVQQQQASRRAAEESIVQLQSVVSGSIAPKQAYEQLVALVQRRLEILARVVEARQTGGSSSAFQHIGTPEVIRLDRDITTIAKTLQDQEVHALDMRLTDAAKFGRRTIALLGTAIVAGLGLVAAVYVILRRELATRIAANARTEAEVRRFKDLFENSPDAMVLVGQDQRITQANTRASEVFLLPSEALSDAPLDRLMPERFRARHLAHMTAYFANPRSRPMGAGLELIGLRGDGSEFPVEIMLSPMKTSSGLQVLAVIRDVTQRAAAEKQIRQLNEDLSKRAAELELANQELEAFSYSVSHDLRAPLRHIQGFADMLTGHAEGVLDEKGKRYLTTISEAARKMSVLIDDLLLFSKMGRAEMAKQKVDLGYMVEDARRTLQQETAGRVIEWVIHPLPEVWADVAMLRQVVFNLLANAVKYSRHRVDARIEVGALSDTPTKEVICFVRDNGAGFDMKYAHKLFGVFQRLHGATEFEGTGVGLAIVRRIVHRLGGRAWAEGAVGQGATFYFSLPEPETAIT